MTEKIIALTAEHLGIDADSISETASFKEDLGVDSLDVVDLIVIISEEFDIEIPDEVVDNIKTVGDIVAYIDSQQQAD